jgi:hypothetical protein
MTKFIYNPPANFHPPFINSCCMPAEAAAWNLCLLLVQIKSAAWNLRSRNEYGTKNHTIFEIWKPGGGKVMFSGAVSGKT